MSFAEPLWFLLLPLVPVLAALAGAAGVLHRRALGRLLSPIMLERALPAPVRARRTARDLLAFAAVGLAVVALAEPRFDKQVQTIRTTGTDIVVVLDLSRSMDARDVDPSRLVRARRELSDLGQLLEGDRVGLVLFAGGAFPRLPLTADFQLVERIVDEASTDIFDAQGSDLGAGLQAALDLLARSDEPAGQAILVLSDGETHDADRALAAAGAASSAGVPVYVMGIGIEEAPIPLPGGRTLQWEGRAATTAPDFEILEQVAKQTGGAFVTSNAASKDMASLYAELRRAVRATERDSRQRETWRSAFQWPLGLAGLMLLLAAWLGDGRRSFGSALVVLFAVALSQPGVAAAADVLADADALYREGKYPQAVEMLLELSLEHPDDPSLLQRLGAARYRAGDFEGAARAFEGASALGGGAEALFDSGNARYRAGKLEDALARYDEVLERDPSHSGATANRDFVQKELEARRGLQPPPPPPPKPGQEDEPPPQDGGEGEEPQPKPEPKPGSEQEDEGAQPSGEPQPADSSEPKPGTPGDPASDGTPSEAGADQDPADAVDPSALDPGENDGDEQDGAATGATGEPGEEGPITAGQAERLLESVGEGTPRMVVGGRPEGKPW